MNKRQAKKAFKKKYGCTPNQASYIIKIFSEFDWCEIAKGVGEAISEIIKAFTEAIPNISIAVTEFMKVIYGEEEPRENKFPKGTRMGAGLRDSKAEKGDKKNDNPL